MADQADYGSNNNGKTLVPGSLVCYRHFAMGLASSPRILAPMHDPYLGTYDPGGGVVFTAECNKKPRYRQTAEEKMLSPARSGCSCSACSPRREDYAAERRMFFDDDGRDIHTPPVPGCTCGFYAHYDPATDFYLGRAWGPGASEFTFFFPSGMAIVRAVVEMTGTTVMGRRGVRAQTMSIKALAVDWAKYREVSGSYFWATSSPEPSPGDSYRQAVEDAGRQTALKYNARYFADLAEMYTAYPKADISALGIEEALPEPPAPEGTARLVLRHQPYSHSSTPQLGITKANASGGYTTTISMADAAWDRLKADIKDQALTPMQRAIRAKKNRPAPPGAGIDYRDRKSR